MVSLSRKKPFFSSGAKVGSSSRQSAASGRASLSCCIHRCLDYFAISPDLEAFRRILEGRAIIGMIYIMPPRLHRC
eukprot:6471647-Amphidinium_carterae.2